MLSVKLYKACHDRRKCHLIEFINKPARKAGFLLLAIYASACAQTLARVRGSARHFLLVCDLAPLRRGFLFWSRDLPSADDAFESPHAWGKDRRGWHIDKTISISDLIAVVTIAVPALIWASTTESRLAVVGEKVAAMEKQRSEDMQATNAKLTDLQLQLRSMDSRMSDRLEKIADKIGAR